MSMLPEILFNVPGTAHCIGGCVIADSSTHGVVDSRHRVFNYKNMYICDGSVVAANLGVNPSLTITALAERAMSFIPPAAETDWNDASLERAALMPDATGGRRTRGQQAIQDCLLTLQPQTAGIKQGAAL